MRPSTTSDRGAEFLGAAVLLICFNRPALTRKAFELVRKAKPSFLYVASDGPRPSRPTDAPLCDEVRSIFDEIDWPCHIERDFAPENMGCERRIITALQRTFEHVDRAIVMEDDLAPRDGFFEYCTTMLDRYADTPRIGTIAGSSYVRTSVIGRSSYYFSRYPNTLGWGTYKRTIDGIDWHPDPDDVADQLRRVLRRSHEADVWADNLRMTYNGTVSTWDYQFVVSQLLARNLSVTPRRSMVLNVGAGPDATNTPSYIPFLHRPSYPAPTAIRHPRRVRRAILLDELHSLGAIPPANDIFLKLKPYGQEARLRLVDHHTFGRVA